MHPEREMRPVRGFTILEVMLALAILLVGLLGLMRLHVLGVSWGASARAQTRATQLALELRAGLEQLPSSDARLGVTGGWSATAPASFRPVLEDDADAVAWDDANPIPGVTRDSALERDPEDRARPRFVRRWKVWGYSEMSGSVSAGAGARLIAISVTYRDKGSLLPREVVVYTQRADAAAAFTRLRTSG